MYVYPLFNGIPGSGDTDDDFAAADQYRRSFDPAQFYRDPNLAHYRNRNMGCSGY